ncbi:MAG TPA: SCP2 sterol-binding domain-containing protein [Acidimicrobiales bacterium]|nr:SCP2 sterol-binding domain-containing protein [Acidimicrobiales bacterium]
MAVEFLSEDWVSLQRELGAALPPRPGVSARVQFTVTGAPGEVVYWLAWEDGRVVDGGLGPDPAAEVQLVTPRALAAELAQGRVEPSVAFMQGRMKTSGDQAALLRVLAATATPEYEAAVRASAERTA